MIPILYEATETAFTSNGLGRLSDCISCTVTEERNGSYELEATYPITGLNYSRIREGRIIAVTHDEQGDVQPFVIYRITRPIDGIVEINAHHISYRLSDIIVRPITAGSVNEAFAAIELNSMSTNPFSFSFWSDNTTAGSLDIKEPRSARAIIGGQQGSILDVFGGEYEFDKLDVKNHAARGSNRGVTIRYGKNLTDLVQESSRLDVYNAIVPYWVDAESETVVYGGVIQQTGTTDTIARAVDYSTEFTERPTVARLEAAARADLESKTPWVPYENLTVDFTALWQLDEYKDVAPLERVQLCDTVTIIYTALGVQATAKVIKVVWDALAEKYTEIELGKAKSSLADTILTAANDSTLQMTKSFVKAPEMQSAIDGSVQHATDLITGGLGGYIVYTFNADGQPQEMCILADSDDIETAMSLWRFNKNGLGHSSTGYEGTFDLALTADGYINASRILTGFLNASRIRGGVLQLGGASDGNGVLQVLDADDNVIAHITRSGISTNILTANNYVQIDGSGNTASFLKIGLLNSGLIELSSANGFRIQASDAGGNVTKDVQLGTVQSTGTTGPLGADVIVADGSVSNHATRAIIRTGSIQLSDLSGSGTGGLAPDGLPVAYARIGTNLFEVVSDYEAGSTRKYVRYQNGAFVVGGGATKNKVVALPEYGDRLLYSYETPEPMYGDVGEGKIAEDGICYVWLDPVFAGTIRSVRFQVFLQAYGPGGCYVAERAADHFVVKGEPGVAFGWEVKGLQADVETGGRLERFGAWGEIERTDYGDLAIKHLKAIYEGRTI